VAAQVAHLPDEVAERVAGWQADSVLTAAVATDTANVIAVVAAMVTAIIALLAVGAVVWFFALARKGVARDEAARQRERGEDEAARRAEREADATVRATEIAAEREARAELRRAHAAIADAVKRIAENRTVTGRELFGVIDPEGAEKLRWVPRTRQRLDVCVAQPGTRGRARRRHGREPTQRRLGQLHP